MADNPIVESNGTYFAQDYSVNSLNLIMANGSKIELKKLMIELSYYEDIYSFVVSGYITVLDAQGFGELLTLSGNEFIEINISKTNNPINAINRIFRLYKMGAKVPTGNQNAEVYNLYFCSEEMLLSEQNKVSKSYKGTKISDIITNIVKDIGPTGQFLTFSDVSALTYSSQCILHTHSDNTPYQLTLTTHPINTAIFSKAIGKGDYHCD